MERDFSSHQKDWKKFESNNKTIALNILYVPHNTKEIRHAYKSKYNLNCENQVILLMITGGGEKWDYLAVKSFSALLRGITPNHRKEFLLFKLFLLIYYKNRLKNIKTYVEIMIIAMLKKIIKY